MNLRKLPGHLLLISMLVTLNMQFSCDYPNKRKSLVDSLFLVKGDLDNTYDLYNPDRTIYLPFVLSEVSGLSFFENDKLLMIEDETGAVYEYDLGKDEVSYRMVFGNNGDYEGVEAVGNQIYVLKSDGDIYTFNYEKEKDIIAQKFETPLSSGNEVEGLAYDANENILLLATKDDGDIKKNEVQGKAIYAWSLSESKMEEKARIIINAEMLDDFFEKKKGRKYEKEKFVLEPSGVAVHPINSNYYILASNGKMMLITDKNGKILAAHPILPSILAQPEGICFAPDGTLYISSEGDGDRGYIQMFSMQKNE